MTVFSFRIFYNNDWDFVQYRTVLASNSEEAIAKLEKYRKQQVKDGYADFTYNNPTVELENVII